MTFKGIVLGLIGACLICGLSYLNDAVMGQTYLVGNNMPISVYGSLVLFLLLVNPLLRLFGRRAAFSGGELAVALAITLAACTIPGSGLMRTFTASLVLPHHYERVEPGWKEQKVVERAPARMLADVSRNDTIVVNGFIQGLGQGKQHISLRQIPWYAWTRTLAFWLPLILTLWVALIALAVVVHRQWADHEQLAYPIAMFTDALLPTGEEAAGGVLRNRLFWIGAAAVLVIHLNNYGCLWFPRYLIQIQTMLDFSSLSVLFPTLTKGGGGWWPLLYAPVYFTPIAFAYFLATDVSLSLGLGGYLFTYITGVFAGYGVAMGGGSYFGPKILSFLGFGAYLGMFLVILYTGRHYYGSVFRRAFGLRSGENVGPSAVWAARAFALCFGVFSASLMVLGLDWPLALFYTAATVMLFLVMSRILAETGIFFIQPYWVPTAILMGFMGVKAIGPDALLIMCLLSTVFLVDPRESLMPFVVNALKLADMKGEKIGRTSVWCVVAVVVGLAVAVPVTLYYQYDHGANMSDGWATLMVPKFAFLETLQVHQRLEAQGSLQLSESLHGWQRFAHLSPDGTMVASFAVGLALVILFTMARYRFPRWPLHPVIFLMWYSTYTGRVFCASLLIGWFIKVAVTKYGGAAGYQKLKPLMFGLIAGDMLGGIVPIVIGFIYHAITGEIPKPFRVMPG